MSEPIENKPAEAQSAETKAAPCGAKKNTLCILGGGAVVGVVVGLLTDNNPGWVVPLGIAVGLVFGAVMRGGGG